MNPRVHAIGHEILRLRINHAILFGDKEPRWFRFPCWSRGRLLNALSRDRPLHGSCNVCLIERSFVGNRLAKRPLRNPYKAMGIWSQLGRFRGFGIAVENLGYGLALIRRECRDIDQTLDSLFLY